MTPRPLLLLTALLALAAMAGATDLDTTHDATVRLTAPDGGRGTGTAFERSQGQTWILTCAHVATANTLQAEFHAAGHQSAAVSSAVLWRDDRSDVAVVRVPDSALGGVLPAVVPLAPPDYAVRPGARLRTAGSAQGAWPTSFVGHAIGYQNGDLLFRPAPANGRSGSAIIDDSGRVVGIVRARAADNSHGLATPVQAIYRLWGSPEQRTRAVAVEMPTVPTQQPFRYQLPLPGVQRRQYEDGFRQGQGGGCGPGGACPAPGGQQQTPPQGGLFGFGYGQQGGGGGGGGGGLWPTLPAGPQSQTAPLPVLPSAPPLDLAPLQTPLDKMAGAVERWEKRDAERAERERQDAIRESLPLDSLGGAAGSAVQGDWSGAGASLTGPEMAAWTAGGVAALLAGFFGARGLFGVLLKLAIAAAVRMGFSYVHGRITAPERTEVDEVIDDVKKPNGTPTA